VTEEGISSIEKLMNFVYFQFSIVHFFIFSFPLGWLLKLFFVLKSQFIFSTQVSLNLNYWMMLNFNGVAISFAKLVGGF
jgi:hypothetical protein